jgi:hypothetical protein
MRHRLIALAAVALASVITSAPAFAQKVNTDFDTKADFSRLKTYTWGKGTPAPNPLMEERIRSGVEQQLAAKGFTKSDTPDVVVVSHVTGEEELDVHTYGYGYGAGWYYGGMGGMSTTQVNKYTVGTLLIDMYELGTKQLVWRGTASDTVSDKPEKNAKKIAKGLEKMFKKYPPKKS